MSDLEDSCDIIPASPDFNFENKRTLNFNENVTRKPDNGIKNIKIKPSSVKSSDSSKGKHTLVEDSDEDIMGLSNDDQSISSISILEESSEASCLDKTNEYLTENCNNESSLSLKNLRPKSKYSSKLSSIKFNNSNFTNDIKNSTFDPSTPEGKWRTSRRISISDDESPILNTERNKRYNVIDSEDDEIESFNDSSISMDINKSPFEPQKENNVEDVYKEKSVLIDENISINSVSSASNESKQSFNNDISEITINDQSLISCQKTNSTLDHNKKRFEGLPTNLSIQSKEKQFNNSNQSSKSVANISSSSVSSCSSLDLSNMSQAEIESNLKKNKMILKTANVNILPDKGARIKERIHEMNEALARMSMEGKMLESSTENINKKGFKKGSSFSKVKEESSLEPEVLILSPEFKNKSFPVEVAYENKTKSEDRLLSLKEQLYEKQMLFKATNLRSLPDGGSRLREAVAKLEKEIMLEECKASIASKFSENKQNETSKERIKVIEATSHPDYKQIDPPALQVSSLVQAIGASKQKQFNYNKETLFGMNQDFGVRSYKGKLSEATEKRMIRMTSDVVEELHKILKSMPNVDMVEEDQPGGLKVYLMPHQKRALAWLLWREAQVPAGGILADDMGLGKTLTMLALILKHKELVAGGHLPEDLFNSERNNSEEDLDTDEDEDEGWISKNTRRRLPIIPSKGTLVVCPASLIGQWESESRKHISKKMIKVYVYHGNSRDISLRRLAQYDVVVTTYQLAMREAFSDRSKNNSKKRADSIPEIDSHDQGPLYRINWARIILDEAHQIRNHTSKTSQAVSMLRGLRRWAVTGTPVQNRESDLFSVIRFLRLSPFDDFACWKHQLTGNVQGMRKLNLIIRTLLLRRNKDQVDQKTGEAIVTLPPKKVSQHMISLSQEEREVYDRVFSFSRSSLIQYMKSQEEREKEKAQKGGYAFKPSIDPQNYNEVKYTPTLSEDILKMADIKSHHMLILLLRLRQICSHPALVHSILESEAKTTDSLNADFPAGDLVDQISQLSLGDKENKGEEIDNRIKDQILCESNPVFKKKMLSSKISKVLEELKHLDDESYEKAIIVSQWTSMLEIVHKHLRRNGFKCTAITGQIPVKDRQSIVDEFNTEGKGPRVLLLSLCAGGVGLNLVGANHLFLLDMHWNPQLETQACDRIYRVGQKRAVNIHRFVTMNTVEEKILELQKKKIDLAETVLSGAKRTQSHKLTLQDLKALFSLS